jgi:hypothetical protein
MANPSQHSAVMVLRPHIPVDIAPGVPQRAPAYDRILVAGAAFCLYWLSSSLLHYHVATGYFGSDANLYALLAFGHVEERLLRFHPVTIYAGLAWMDALRALAPWINPTSILSAMFASIGAIGVWAAMSAFAHVVPRREVPIWGAIYALCFGIWFFASVAESKIVTASLAAIYIALYLGNREKPTSAGSAFLLLAYAGACLNEIVSAALILIPAFDTVLSGRLDCRRFGWLAAQALVVPLTLVAMEVLRVYAVPAATWDQESGSMVSMLLFYASANDHGPASLYAFLLNWLFFNVAAPSPFANYATPIWPNYAGYFEPSLANYLSRPVTVALTILACGLAMAALFLRRGTRPAPIFPLPPLVFALLAYTIARATFFFLFNPAEALQFSPAVVLAHILLLAIGLAGAEFQGKRLGLGLIAALLLMTNSTFIFLANTGVVPLPQQQDQIQQQQPQPQPFPQQQFQPPMQQNDGM